MITHSITWLLAGSYPSPSILGNSHKLPHNPEIMKNLQPTVQCRAFDDIVEELWASNGWGKCWQIYVLGQKKNGRKEKESREREKGEGGKESKKEKCSSFVLFLHKLWIWGANVNSDCFSLFPPVDKLYTVWWHNYEHSVASHYIKHGKKVEVWNNQ